MNMFKIEGARSDWPSGNKFTYNGNTLAGNYNLHCLFANISYLRVSNGGLSITLTKS